jgi:hypothetical protein
MNIQHLSVTEESIYVYYLSFSKNEPYLSPMTDLSKNLPLYLVKWALFVKQIQND